MKSSQKSQILFQKAFHLHQRGHVKQAQSIYRAILLRDPTHFDSRHLLGLTLVQTGLVEEGAGLISAALKLNPDSAAAYYNLGHALNSLKRYDEALTSLERAMSSNRLTPKLIWKEVLRSRSFTDGMKPWQVMTLPSL